LVEPAGIEKEVQEMGRIMIHHNPRTSRALAPVAALLGLLLPL
jgi:hypothetical protein